MAATFDCYYKWLGIPPEEQPPDHYRLLGVRRFESDPDVIDNAASRQMAHVRTFQAGPQAVLSQKLLNEIARARVCLLDAAQKAKYDAELAARLQGTQPPLAGAVPDAPLPALAITTRAPPRQGGARGEAKRSSPSVVGQVLKIGGGGVVGLALGYLIVYWVMGDDPLGIVPPRAKQIEQRVAVAPHPKKSPIVQEPTEPKPSPTEPAKEAVKRPVGPEKPVAKGRRPQQPGTSRAREPKSAPDVPKAAIDPAEPMTQASPPQPAARPEVLAGMAEAWRLPAPGATSAAKVATLAREPDEPIAVSMRSEAAALAAMGVVALEAEESGKTWVISYATEANAAAKTRLASLRREGLDFMFGWAAPMAEAEVLQQVANCQLDIRHGSDLRTVQLRESHAAGELMLDLTDDKQSLEVPVAGLPKLDRVRLKIRELANFPEKAAIRDEGRTLALGEQAVIEFGDQPGAEIGLRFFQTFATGKLVLRLAPVFRENKVREYALTLKHLEATREAMAKVSERARESLAEAEMEVAAGQRVKSSLESQRPGGNDLQARAIWEPRYQQVNSAIGRAASRVQRLKEQIAESQGRLAAVPKLKSFLESVHQRASIRYVICAECPGRDIVLVDGTRGSGSAETP